MLKSFSIKAQRIGYYLLCIPILAAPWFFGSWEMWWFWPFAALIFAASLPFGAITTLKGIPKHRHLHSSRSLRIGNPLRLMLLVAYLPFLAYAAIWFLNAEVIMDAERSFQLFLTALLIGAHVVYGLDRANIRQLHLLLCIDLLLLAAYGIVNHAVTHSAKVMWAIAFPQYVAEHRASGSYFCPDHFSGAMEIGVALALGLIFDRKRPNSHRLLGALMCGLGAWGIILSKSRGGGLVLLIMIACFLVWGVTQWSRRIRWIIRAGLAALATIVLVSFVTASGPYMQRFLDPSHFDAAAMRGKPAKQAVPELIQRLKTSCRGRMYSGAWRAWLTRPVIGIGPGMHQNLWFHFAASPDGNREQGVWPTLINNDFHSYEVHNDWLQLLEEYGIVGLLLFSAFFVAALAALFRGIKHESLAWQAGAGADDCGRDFAVLLGGLLAGMAMAFHSFVDFNLQIPATTWMLAFVVAAALRTATTRDTETGPKPEPASRARSN